MICRPITIINKLGLHARATNKLVTTASRFDSKITLKAKGREVDARNIMQVMMLAASQGTEVELAADGSNIMQVMMLAASQGTEVELAADGPDEQEAIDALVALIDDYFGEGE